MLAALAPMIYLIHLSLLWAVVILSNPRLIFAAVLIPGVFLCSGVLIKSRLPRGRWILLLWTVPYYLLCTAFAAGVVALTYKISPALTASYVIYSCWSGWFVHRNRPRALRWLLLLMVPSIQFLWFDLRWAALAIPVLLLIGIAGRRGLLAHVSGWAVCFFILGLCLISEGGVFYLRPSFFETFDISDQAVTPILSGRASEAIPLKNLRFAVQGCAEGRYYVGARADKQALWLIDDRSARPVWAMLGGEASDNAAPLCDRGIVYVGDFRKGRLLGLRAEDGEVLSEWSIEDTPRPSRRRRFKDGGEAKKPAMLTFLVADSARGRLYATTDYSGNLIVLDIQTGRELGRILVEGSAIDFTIEPRTGRLVIIGGGGKLFAANPEDLAPRQVGAVPGLLIFQVAIDEETGLVLVSSFFAGRVWAFDPEKFEVVGTRFLGPGVRFMADVPGQGVAVSNFFSGELTLLDPASMEVLGNIRTGRRTRWIELTRDGRGLSTVSSAGPLVVDLEALRGKR